MEGGVSSPLIVAYALTLLCFGVMFWLPGGLFISPSLLSIITFTPLVFGYIISCSVCPWRVIYLQFTLSPFPTLVSSWTNRILNAKDHASVQISVADVDEVTGKCTGTNTTFGMCVPLLPFGASF